MRHVKLTSVYGWIYVYPPLVALVEGNTSSAVGGNGSTLQFADGFRRDVTEPPEKIARLFEEATRP